MEGSLSVKETNMVEVITMCLNCHLVILMVNIVIR